MDQGMSEYLANIEARDRREQIQKRYIDLYSRLADRLATAESSPALQQSSPGPEASSNASKQPVSDEKSLRELLAAAQKARADLEAELASLKALKRENASQAKTIDARTRDVALLQRKVRDREEEIKEGKKLIEQVQDEMVSLNLQLNMSEQKSEKLEAENKELVRRWMKKMGEEADRMNEESKW